MEAWMLISSGPLSLPETRFMRTFVRIDSPSAYTSYQLIFPTVKDPAAANSMQIADIQFCTGIVGTQAISIAMGTLTAPIWRYGKAPWA